MISEQRFKKNKEIDAQYTKNMLFFKESAPEVYDTFINYVPENLTIAFDEEDVVLVNKATGTKVYSKSPREFAVDQVDEFLNFGNANIVKFFDPKVKKTENYHHNDMMDRFIDAYEDKPKPIYRPKNEDVIQQLFIAGVGTGYHIVELLKKQRVHNVVIFDDSLDALYLSFYFIDWLEVFSLAEGGVEIVIEDDESGFFNRFGNYFSNVGNFFLSKFFVFQHYKRPLLNEVLDNFTFKVKNVNSALGFYDDERVGLAHTVANLEKGVPVSKISLLQRGAKNDTPVVIVGNGPSLDDNVDFINRIKDRAVIISCGTTIGTLERLNIKPDIHVEQERPLNTYDWLASSTTESFREGVYFYGLNTVYPDLFDLFDQDKLGMCVKGNDAGLVYLTYSLLKGNTLAMADSANPTVSNFGMSLCTLLGFHNLYLIGVDLGMKSLSEHHSKSSVYHENKEIEKNTNSLFDRLGSLEVEGKNGAKVWTNAIYDSSRKMLEGLIDKYNLNVKNLGDGAKIKGAEFVDSSTIVFPELDVGKNDLLASLHSSVFSQEGVAGPERELVKKHFSSDMGYLKAKLFDDLGREVTTESQMVAAFSDFRYSFYNSNLHPFTKSLLKGSVEMILLGVYSTVAYNGKKNLQSSYEQCLLAIKDFIAEIERDVENRFYELDRYTTI